MTTVHRSTGPARPPLPGQVVVRDQVSAPPAATSRPRLFLPPAAPDGTPIEPACSKLTAIRRGRRGRGARHREA